MKAIQFDRFGGPEVLEMRDVAKPSPKSDEVLICSSAIAVNFTDNSLRSGLYPLPLPSGLGMDTVGVIEAVGDGVTDWRVGDRVACSAAPAGAYAEYRCIAQDRLLRAPTDIDDDILVSILMKGLTAHFLMNQTFAVAPGHTVLFHSAAGGVGSFATQWASSLGATVIGAVGSDAKMDLALKAGCAGVVNIEDPDWPAKVRKLLDGRGVDVAHDCVGKDTFEGSVSCLEQRGMYVNFGMQSGPPPPVDLAAMRRRGSFYFTSPVGAHYPTGSGGSDRAFAEIFDAVRSGRVKIEVKHRFRLDETRQAHEALLSRATTGPIVLIP